MRTDAAWRQIGRDDPYYGVLSHPRFRAAAHNGPERDEFFRSGVEHLDRVMAAARQLDPEFAPNRALDFGCGVGRILLPLARAAHEVVGVDVSPNMLAEARRNCDEAGAANVTLLETEDSLTSLEGSFDFIHSFIIFQHIPPARGLAITRALLERLRESGIGALHYIYAIERSRLGGIVAKVLDRASPLHVASNFLGGRRRKHARIQMNEYPLNQLFGLLQAAGCHRTSIFFSLHHEHRGVMLIFQRSKGMPF